MRFNAFWLTSTLIFLVQVAVGIVSYHLTGSLRDAFGHATFVATPTIFLIAFVGLLCAEEYRFFAERNNIFAFMFFAAPSAGFSSLAFFVYYSATANIGHAYLFVGASFVFAILAAVLSGGGMKKNLMSRLVLALPLGIGTVLGPIVLLSKRLNCQFSR